MTYSLDFRRKVLSIKEQENLSFAEVSKRFGIAINTAFLWSKNLFTKKHKNKPATKLDMEALRRDVQEYPDGYQHERAERLGVSRNCIHFALKRMGVSF